MAAGVRLIGGRRAWPALALLLGTLALGGLAGASAPALEWRPELAAREPWRAWTAAFVHRDGAHLLANLAGAFVVGLFGWAAGCRGRATVAWFAAWPLTQAALLVAAPGVAYAGLSGVLHAGVAVAATDLVARGSGRPRVVGALVLAGLLLKLLQEQAWVTPLRSDPEWAFPVAVAAHATGALAGLGCALVAWATSRPDPLATMPR